MIASRLIAFTAALATGIITAFLVGFLTREPFTTLIAAAPAAAAYVAVLELRTRP